MRNSSSPAIGYTFVLIITGIAAAVLARDVIPLVAVAVVIYVIWRVAIASGT